MIKLKETMTMDIIRELKSFCTLNDMKDDNVPHVADFVKTNKGNIYFETLQNMLRWWSEGNSEIKTRSVTARFIGRLIQEYFRNYREERYNKPISLDDDADLDELGPEEREFEYARRHPDKYKKIMERGLDRTIVLYEKAFSDGIPGLSIYDMATLYNYIKATHAPDINENDITSRMETLKKWEQDNFKPPMDKWGRPIINYVRQNIPTEETFRRGAFVSIYIDLRVV